MFLLSKPEDWKVVPSAIQKHFGIGKDKYYRIIDELKDYGVIVREPVRDESGRVVEWDCIVFEHPVFSPLPENPHD